MSIEGRVRNYNQILQDALRHAGNVAASAQEGTSGSEATLLYNAARAAIADFRENHPAFRALADFGVRNFK